MPYVVTARIITAHVVTLQSCPCLDCRLQAFLHVADSLGSSGYCGCSLGPYSALPVAHHATGFGAQTLAEWAISKGQ